MASARLSSALVSITGALSLFAVGACATLLGDDFSIGAGTEGGGGNGGTTTVGGGGEGGTGGSVGGGGSGGSGGGGLTQYACGWLFGQHQVVASTEGISGEYFSGRLRVQRVDGDRARAFVERSTPNGTVVQVFTLQDGQPPQESSFPARDLYQVERTSLSGIGALYTRDDADGPVLALASIGDGDVDGSNAFHRDLTILGLSAFPSIDPSYGLKAMFTPIPGGGSDVDFVVGYRQTSGNYVEGYGAYRGAPVTAVRITPNNNAPDGNANEPRLVAHHQGQTFAFFGEYTQAGTRQYTLDESVTGWQTPRAVPPAEVVIFDAQPAADTSNIVAVTEGPPLRLLAAKWDNAALGTVDLNGLAVAGEFESEADLPMAIAGFGWLGDVAAFIGSDFDDVSVTRYWFFDVEGQPRGLADLPFTAPLAADETRNNGISDGVLTRRQTTFGPGPSNAHVVWRESHQSPGGNFYVIYYDQLVCVPE